MFSSKHIVALDIGSSKIKIVVGQKNRNNLTIKKISIIDTPEHCVIDGVIQDRSALINALDYEVQKLSLRNYHINLVLSTSKLILRKIETPKLNPKEIKNFVALEAEQYVPGDIRNYIIDYMNIEEKRDGDVQKQFLTLIACPKNIIDGYIEVMGILGLRLDSIDINGNCILRLVDHIRKNHPKKEIEGTKTSAIIDLGFEGTKILIEKNGSMEVNRIVARPSYNLAQILAQTYNTSIDNIKEYVDVWEKQYNSEADDIAATMSSYDDTEAVLNAQNLDDFPLLNNIKSSLDELLRDVMVVFNYYISRNNGNAIDAIYLTGGGAQLKGVQQYISNYFSLPCHNLTLEKFLSGKESRELIKNNELYLANALGLMLRHPRQEVNLLPEHLKKQPMDGLISASAVLVALIIASSAFAGYMIPKTQYLKITKNNKTIVKEIEALRPVEQQISQLNQRKQAIDKTVEIIENIEQNQVLITNILVDVAIAMPKEITISQYSKTNGIIALSGSASSYSQISDFIYNLENKIGAKDVVLSSIANDNGSLQFQLTYDINR